MLLLCVSSVVAAQHTYFLVEKKVGENNPLCVQSVPEDIVAEKLRKDI